MRDRGMNCAQAKSLFSSYMDRVVSGRQMLSLDRHLNSCDLCRHDFSELRQTMELVSKAATRKAPPDLALKLRLAISHEAAAPRHAYLEYLVVRFENAVRSFMVPAMAGLITAVLLFGVFIGFYATPLHAGSADAPVLLRTAPELQQTAFGPMSYVNDDSLVIEAYIDSRGRVEDYRILSESRNPVELTPEVKSMLIDFMTFTTFRPATSMGQPTEGRAILAFSRVNVKG